MSYENRCRFCGKRLTSIMDVCNCQASRQERKGIEAANRTAPRGPATPTMDWFARQLGTPKPPAGKTDDRFDPNELDRVFPDFVDPVARE